MRFLNAIVLGAASLAAAAPVNQTDTVLDKRYMDGTVCGLQNYQSATIGRIDEAVQYLWGNIGDVPDTVLVTKGHTERITCSGNTGIYLSINDDSDDQDRTFPPKRIGTEIDMLYKDCNGGHLTRTDTAVRAMQFWADGYNILIAGNAGC